MADNGSGMKTKEVEQFSFVWLTVNIVRKQNTDLYSTLQNYNYLYVSAETKTEIQTINELIDTLITKVSPLRQAHPFHGTWHSMSPRVFLLTIKELARK